eukprot:1142604-Pelagomonas_calceolata.AAC.3
MRLPTIPSKSALPKQQANIKLHRAYSMRMSCGRRAMSLFDGKINNHWGCGVSNVNVKCLSICLALQAPVQS